MSSNTPPLTHPLVLASSSPFRRQLLEKLHLPFTQLSPEIDETPAPDEGPVELVLRLAREKAVAAARRGGRGLVIGSDQVALLDGQITGKPGDHDSTVAQLRRASGRTVTFVTGLCLYNSDSGRHQSGCELFRVHFRTLAEHIIQRYVAAEQPFNCAGGFKSEGLGITLFKGLEGRDPNALTGLPLILLTDFLAAEGVTVP